MLPRPCLSFTLPSIHDNTKLDCRVYHPPWLRDTWRCDSAWPRHAAVVAHPYAPLGGCFDDPIVDLVAVTLLHLGFFVATFNFRGAASSQSSTSWTSKPEQADYMSVVGFLAYYVHHLSCPPSAPPTKQHELPIMLLAGYSYGATIVTRLPSLDTILAKFETPVVHTAEADIRLRALHLAEAQNSQLTGPASPRKSLGVRVGGEEDTSRRSHEANPMLELQREERIRESVRNLLAHAKLVYRSSAHPSSDHGSGVKDHCLQKIDGAVAFRSAYLAVSPPVGLVTRLATMSFPGLSPSFWTRRSRPVSHDESSVMEHVLLSSNSTLVIYGDQDGFISYRKMREWTRQLAGADASRFRHVEVTGAGHFWAEGDVIYQLRDAIGTFATDLIRLDGTSGPSPRVT